MGSSRPTGRSCPLRREFGHWIDRLSALAQLEMQLRAIDVARLPDPGDHLPALYLAAPLHQQRIAMGVGGDPAVGVANQKQVAESPQLIAGIDDDPVLCRLNRCAERCRDVDPVIVLAAILGPERRDDLPVYRPEEFSGAARGRLGKILARLRSE